MIALMAALGHPRFSIAGHDRGGRVAYRLALDHPERVVRLAVLDILPTFEVWERMNKDAAMRSYHWLFLAQPAPLPERLIGLDPDFYLLHLLNRWAGSPDALDPAAVAEYARHFRKPSVIEATCEDYRAGATVDLEHDRADRASWTAAVLPAARAVGPAVSGRPGGLAARCLAAVGRRRARRGARVRTLSRRRAARGVRGGLAGIFCGWLVTAVR